MTPRIRELAGPGELPQACRACVFWEVAGTPQGPSDQGEKRKDAWWRATELEWGVPGKGAYLDDELVGYVTFGTAAHFPGARTAGKAPSADALVMATLWVDEHHRQSGVARALVQVALREAVRHKLKAVEVIGVRVTDPSPWRCVVPVTFLEQLGFEVLYDDVLHPLLRLDLTKTARWHEHVGQAVDAVVSTLSRRERLSQRAPDTGLARTEPF